MGNSKTFQSPKIWAAKWAFWVFYYKHIHTNFNSWSSWTFLKKITNPFTRYENLTRLSKVWAK